MKKWVKYLPLIVGAVGLVLGTIHEPDEGFAHWLGAGIGMFVISSVPALIIGSLHYIPVRHKTVDKLGNEVQSMDVLDSEIETTKKYTWYYLYCCYLGGFGAFFTLILLAQISRGAY